MNQSKIVDRFDTRAERAAWRAWWMTLVAVCVGGLAVAVLGEFPAASAARSIVGAVTIVLFVAWLLVIPVGMILTRTKPSDHTNDLGGWAP